MSSSSNDAARRRIELTVVQGEGHECGSVEHTHLPDGGLTHPEDPNFRAFHSFAQFLSTRPALDDVARFLVGMVNWPLDANACLIVANSGTPRQVLALHVDQVHPWVGVARTRLVPADVAALLDSENDVVSAYWDPPVSSNDPHFGLWTLGAPSDPIAYLVVTFRTHPDIDTVEMLVRPLGGLLAIYLAGIQSYEHLHIDTHSHNGEMAHGRPNGLNERQREILTLMAQGLTNPQIAARIGFSESTVRMESLTIYRFLGVHDRHDAVIAGQNRGLIPPMASD